MVNSTSLHVLKSKRILLNAWLSGMRKYLRKKSDHKKKSLASDDCGGFIAVGGTNIYAKFIKRTKQTCLSGTDDNRLLICKFLR